MNSEQEIENELLKAALEVEEQNKSCFMEGERKYKSSRYWKLQAIDNDFFWVNNKLNLVQLEHPKITYGSDFDSSDNNESESEEDDEDQSSDDEEDELDQCEEESSEEGDDPSYEEPLDDISQTIVNSNCFEDTDTEYEESSLIKMEREYE
jgi:hypothetical protein